MCFLCLLASLEIRMGWEECYSLLLGQCLQRDGDSAAGFTELLTMKRCFVERVQR